MAAAAVWVATVGCNCGSDVIPVLGTPLARGRPKKEKKKKRKEKNGGRYKIQNVFKKEIAYFPNQYGFHKY